MAKLFTPKAPRLPSAPVTYDERFFNQHGDVLRLYFNQIDNVTGSLLGPRGGQYLNTPYASVQRTTDLTLTANTATEVLFNQNDYMNGCANDGTDGIQVTYPGIYNYQFSIQFANTDTQAHNAWVWLRKNNVDIAGTGSKWDVPAKHGTSDGYIIAAANFFVDLAATDKVSMFVAADSALAYIEAYPAQTTPFVMPSVPSVVATLSFVSGPLA